MDWITKKPWIDSRQGQDIFLSSEASSPTVIILSLICDGVAKVRLRGSKMTIHLKVGQMLCSSRNIIPGTKSSRIAWAGHVARMGKRTGAKSALVGKPEETRTLYKPRCI
jgi:hypothetical protein